jgi:branched-chain amino acid transport system permease protein
VPKANIFGFVCNNEKRLFYLIFTVALVMFVMAKNLVRPRVGRAFTAIRDSDIATESMGINLFKNKMIAFGISAFFAGVAGSLFSLMATFISPENFTLMDSISFVVMILVGGLGSISGSIMGAAFITLLSEVIRSLKDYLPAFLTAAKGLQALIYGGCIVLFIMYEPSGLHGRWLKIRLYFETFPLGKRPKSKRMMVTGARDLSM